MEIPARPTARLKWSKTEFGFIADNIPKNIAMGHPIKWLNRNRVAVAPSLAASSEEIGLLVEKE